jgi:hypothetical protein
MASFLEGRSQNMRLDDVEPRVFGLLVDWVYSEYLAAAVMPLRCNSPSFGHSANDLLCPSSRISP